MTQNFTITSDVVERLKKIRQGIVYNDLFAVLDELVQNSYRANATKVEITLIDDYLEIKDNGKGCISPEPLFTLDVSGFGIGFGEGFNSVYMIADELMVQTLNWKGYLDIDKALKTKDLSVRIKNTDELFQGFMVKLKGQKIKQNLFDLIDYAIEAFSLIPNINFYINGEFIPKKDIFSLPNPSKYYQRVENKYYEGLIDLTSSSDYGVKVYYEYRFVTNIYKKGIQGVILLKNNAVNLRVPDRRDIIYDKKRDNLEYMLRQNAKTVAKEILQQGSSEDILNFADVVETYMDVNEYINFLTIDKNSILNQYETREVATQELSPTDFMMDNEYAVSVMEQLSSSGFALQDGEAILFGQPRDTKRKQDDMNFTSYVKPQSNLATKEDMEKISIRNISKKKNVVWVEKDRLEFFQDDINQFEYYGIYTFVSPHILYDRALSFLNIPHIQTVENDGIRKDYSVQRIGAKSKKEERVMELLSYIEKELDLPSTFFISDIDCKMIVELRGSKIFQKKLEVEGYKQGDVIHFNRKSLKMGKLSSILLGRNSLSIHDVKFLLSNIELIAHELAHLIYGTKDNTKEHYEAQNKIQTRIGDIVMNCEELY